MCMKKYICPYCFCGRVTTKGEKPYKLNDEFADCQYCNGTGFIESKWIGEHCKKCGREQRLAWSIKDDIWNYLVPGKWKEKVLCMECFLEMVPSTYRITLEDFTFLDFLTGDIDE